MYLFILTYAYLAIARLHLVSYSFGFVLTQFISGFFSSFLLLNQEMNRTLGKLIEDNLNLPSLSLHNFECA